MSGRRPSRVVVVGATFGQLYVEAVRRRPDLELVALLARGSEVARATAGSAGVPLVTDPDELPTEVDLACVAVRTGQVGGAGTAIAVRLLERGTPVLQELPVGSRDATACLRAAARSRTPFAVADLYRWLPTVRAFSAAAAELVAAERPLTVTATLSVQPAYMLARLLTEIGLPVRPVCLTTSASGLVSGTLGGVPVTVQHATALNARDTDDDVRFPSVSVHTASGTLTMTDVHGRVLWTPTLHLPDGARSPGAVGVAELAGVAADEELFAAVPTHTEVLGTLWPDAVGREIEAALEGSSAGAAQRTLQVAELWEAMTSGIDFPVSGASSGFADRAALAARLRAAASGTARPRPDREIEGPR